MRRSMVVAWAAACLVLLVPGAAGAAIEHFGSSLSARATLTTDDLDYAGINTPDGRGPLGACAGRRVRRKPPPGTAAARDPSDWI